MSPISNGATAVVVLACCLCLAAGGCVQKQIQARRSSKSTKSRKNVKAAKGAKAGKAARTKTGGATTSPLRHENKTKPSLGELMLVRIKRATREVGVVDLHVGQDTRQRRCEVTSPAGKTHALESKTSRMFMLEMPFQAFQAAFPNGKYTYSLTTAKKALPVSRNNGTIAVSGVFPAYPTPVAPIPGATGVARRLKIKWKNHGRGVTRALSIEDSKGKEVVNKDLTSAQSSFQLTAAQALKPGASYLLLLEAEDTRARRASVMIVRFTTGR